LSATGSTKRGGKARARPGSTRPASLHTPLQPSSRGGFLAHEIVPPSSPMFVAIDATRFPDWRRVGPATQQVRRSCEPNAPRRRRSELAARLYREALADMANAPEMWVQYGHALKESGNVGEAEAAYRPSAPTLPTRICSLGMS
jgi:hypothetical protein